MVERWPHVILIDPFSAGLAVARRTARLGARVSVLAEPDAWEIFSRGVSRESAVFGADGEAWLDRLRGMAASGDEAIVVPGSDRASELLVRAGGHLPGNLRMFERAGRGHLALMDKDSAHRIARQAGVPVPWAVTIDRREQLPEAVDRAPWPCVVKPVHSHVWRARFSQRRVFLVRHGGEAMRMLEPPLADGIPMLLCQYVPGGDADVEEAIVVRLPDGSYPVSFGCHKLRQYPRGFGSTTLGESATLPETMDLARRVLDEAGFVGVAGVETKRDSRTGQRWFLEVNVRLPGQWGLGDACGTDATRRLVWALTGRPSGAAPPLKPGVRFVEPVGDAKACRELLRRVPTWRRPAEAWRLLRPYFGAGELGLLDLSDPRPALVCTRRILTGKIISRAARRRTSITDAGAPRFADAGAVPGRAR